MQELEVEPEETVRNLKLERRLGNWRLDLWRLTLHIRQESDVEKKLGN